MLFHFQFLHFVLCVRLMILIQPLIHSSPFYFSFLFLPIAKLSFFYRQVLRGLRINRVSNDKRETKVHSIDTSQAKHHMKKLKMKMKRNNMKKTFVGEIWGGREYVCQHTAETESECRKCDAFMAQPYRHSNDVERVISTTYTSRFGLTLSFNPREYICTRVRGHCMHWYTGTMLF